MQEVKQPNKKPFIFYYMIALIVIIPDQQSSGTSDRTEGSEGSGLQHFYADDL